MEQSGGDSRPLAPHLYSGLETEGMKLLHCTLKLQPDWIYDADIISLAPQRVVVPLDGQPHRNVRFHGCKILQLKVGKMDDEGGKIMPAPLTIGGPCTYSEADKKDFKIMTRTKEQSLLMHLPPNGEFDWPDYRAFETCPVCCRRAKPGTNERYWLLFQPLLQHFENETQAGMAIRFITRLTCEDCFETITEDKYVQTKVQGETSFREVPLLDVVEEQGPITWLNDGQMSARSPSGAILNAYALYGSWEHSGAWQVLTNHFESNFNELASKSIPGGLERRPGKAMTKDSSTFWEMSQIPIKEGMECDGPDCSRVHGNRMAPEQGKKKGKKIRLQECMGCFEAYYCSEKCQRAGWADHKESCKEIQRKRKEEDEKKKEQQMMDDEAKMEAALASFVPVNITPQGGGAKKKRGKKGGGKKKSGKKK